MAEFKLWSAVEMPLYVLIGWSLISLLMQVYVSGIDILTIGIIGWIIMIAAFSYSAFIAIKAKQGVGTAVKAGALLGALAGLVSAILGIISFYAFPQLFASTIEQMGQGGMGREQAMSFMQIGIYISLITAPIISAIIGVIITAIAGWIMKAIIK